SSATIGGIGYGNFAGATPVGVVSVGSLGAERQITNVAAGRVTASSTDAINGSQLFSVAQEVSSLSTGLSTIAGGLTSLSTGLSSTKSTVASLSTGAGNGSGGGTASGNGSTASGSGSSATGDKSSSFGSGATASGTGSTAMGAGSTASGSYSSADGYGATASGENSTALGAKSTASGANSVALGAGSIANEANTVSVGSPGNERRITNVAPGVNPTDAVNMSQLGGVQQSITDTARAAYSGVAAATALTMIPNVDPDKRVAIGIGGATYKGYGAAALGVSVRINKNLAVRVGAGISAAGQTYGVGMTYRW
ncbi:YadA family autotransporter adhesin, partial [Burkholderia vietnamiensis]|uniref:YadA family autotransporter adhesin n=1 Tax=Burkholderia vietnamiensis TaxID=60552 RepID=UPI000AA40DD3